MGLLSSVILQLGVIWNGILSHFVSNAGGNLSLTLDGLGLVAALAQIVENIASFIAKITLFM